MLRLLLVILLVIFAVQAVRTRMLLTSALWLAGVSALLSVLLYMYGAHLVSVVELSVGAGLVTVLFVFAINIAGDDALEAASIPQTRWIAATTVLFVGLLGWYIWPVVVPSMAPAVGESAIRTVLWQERGLDLMVQMVLILSGVLGLLGLLAEARPPLEGSMALEVSARRDLELQTAPSQVLQIQEHEK